MSEIKSSEDCSEPCCANKINPYREYEVRVTLKIHESLPSDGDWRLVTALRQEIADLVTGDLIIVKVSDYESKWIVR